VLRSATRRRAVAAAGLLVLLGGCGGGGSSTRLAVAISQGFGPQLRTRHFTLRCDPTGGDMPHRASLCRIIGLHPRAMLFPADARSTCIGGIGIPEVTVRGTSRGRHVSLEGAPLCTWPGGVGPFAYWAAASEPADLPSAAARLHCEEDADLLAPTTPWKRVRACLGSGS
jgi:hypothetical protein